MNSFTSVRPGEDSTSSTLLRKVWVEEKGHHRTVASYSHGWALCVCVYICVGPRYLCEVVGRVMRNGPIGQFLQKVQHWVRGASDLFRGMADDRRTHFSGRLGRQQIRI